MFCVLCGVVECAVLSAVLCVVVLCCVWLCCSVLFFLCCVGVAWGAEGRRKEEKKQALGDAFGSQNCQKIGEKSVLEGSWEALGRSWGPRGPIEPPKCGGAFAPLNINRLLERSWGGLGALLGSSWGVSWAIFLALGRSWRGFGSASVAKALPRAIFFEFVLLLGRAEP